MTFSPSKSNYFNICFNKFNQLIGTLMDKDNRVTNSQMKRITRLPIGMMNKKTKMIKMEITVMKDKMTMIAFLNPK